MTESMHWQASRSGGLRPARVLVFSVDDGLFALHIDWVEAMYPRGSIEVRTVRNDAGEHQPFLLHAGVPAMLVDLRDAFGLTAVLGPAQRRETLVVRTPGFLLAVPVDACVGIRELDCGDRPPVPSGLARDGGFAVGHLVTLDGKPMAVLDPSHLLEARQRDALAPLVEKARGFEERERRREALWDDIREQPTVANLRAFARLCSRNGRSRLAVAARVVLRHFEAGRWRDHDAAAGETTQPWEPATGAEATASALAQGPLHERMIRELVCLEVERVTGELIVPQGDGAEESRIHLDRGRVVQAQHRAERGRSAFRQLLAAQPEHFYFVETDAPAADRRIAESTAALIIATLATLGRERHGRHPGLDTMPPPAAGH